IFPTDADRLAAVQATIFTIRPPGGGDNCPNYIKPVPDPVDQNSLLKTDMVDFNMGVPARALKAIPTGRDTILVNIKNSQQNLFLHGCVTQDVESGSRIAVTLVALNPTNDDMGGGDGHVDDLLNP